MSQTSFPLEGRIAGVDYGTVRIGVSICDPSRILVSPYDVHSRRNEAETEQYFKSLVQSERIEGFVVGLPIHCDGGESDKSREARQFAKWLQLQTQVPVRLFDERFSTAQAKRRLQKGRKLTRQKQKERLDAVAAQVLLEAFIEVQAYTGKLPGESPEEEAAGGDPLD